MIKRNIIITLLVIILIVILSIFIQRENIISILQNKKAGSLQDINFETYYNKSNVLKILVTAIDTDNGIKTLTYEKEDGNKVELNGNGKNKIAIDYQVEKDGKYEFKFINGAGEEISKVLNIDNKYRRNFLNLNQVNISTFEADGYSGSNVPANAIDNSMNQGNGYNWLGGTKLLIEYNTLSTITHIGVYTTNQWGSSFDSATIYYSEDDSLTLESNLDNYKSITVNTENIEKLTEKIQAKRIMLIKNNNEAVYEFQCFGNPNIDTEGIVYIDKTLAYPILTKEGMKNIKRINLVNESDYTYEIDLNKQCTAEDALDIVAYDGDNTTYYDPSSGKSKFYLGDDIYIYYACFKIEPDCERTILKDLNGSWEVWKSEGKFLSNGFFHASGYKKNSTIGRGCFMQLKVKAYEIYYDESLE